MAEGWTYFLKHDERTLELTEGKLTVGRSRHCDLSIQEPSISRKHVFLTVGDGQVLVQDLGSSNGTFINGERVTGGVLHDGDVLLLGDARLELEVRTEAQSSDDRLEAAPPEPSATESTRETQAGEAAEPEDPFRDDADPTDQISASVVEELKPRLWKRLGEALRSSVKRE